MGTKISRSVIIAKIMFEWDILGCDNIRELCIGFSPKILRWLGAHHPDNKTRKIFYELTNVSIGEGTVINQNFIVSDNYNKLLFIGERVAISPNVTIICVSGPNNSSLANNEYVKNKLIVTKKVIIENDCWVGSNVVILPGIRIGKESIVGAGSIVTKDIENKSIYSGAPAKLIRRLI